MPALSKLGRYQRGACRPKMALHSDPVQPWPGSRLLQDLLQDIAAGSVFVLLTGVIFSGTLARAQELQDDAQGTRAWMLAPDAEPDDGPAGKALWDSAAAADQSPGLPEEAADARLPDADADADVDADVDVDAGQGEGEGEGEGEGAPAPASSPLSAGQFGTGYLTETDGAIQVHLDVASGVPVHIEGLVDCVATEEGISVTLSGEQSFGQIDARSNDGAFGRLELRRLRISLAELDQRGLDQRGPDPREAVTDQDDSLYSAYKRLQVRLATAPDASLRASVLQANQVLMILRANGDLDMQLYHKENAAPLVHLGRLVAPHRGELRFQPTSYGAQQMAQLQEKAQRLRHLEQEILQRSQWLVQQIFLGDFAGREGDIASDTRELDALKSEFQALMDNTVLPEHFDLYGVTESVDYASGHWLKLSGEGGLELAGQAVSFKTLSHLYKTRSAHLMARTHWQDTYTAAQELLDDAFLAPRALAQSPGPHPAARASAYTGLVRRLAAALALAKDKGVPSLLPVQPDTDKPVLRMHGQTVQVLSEPTLQGNLQVMRRALSAEGEPIPDAFLVNEEQLGSMQGTVQKPGWLGWLKTAVGWPAGRSHEAQELQDAMRGLDATGLDTQVRSNHLHGGVPVLVLDEADATGYAIGFVSRGRTPALAARAESVLMDAQPGVLLVENTVFDDPDLAGPWRRVPLDAALGSRIEQETLNREKRLAQSVLHRTMRRWKQPEQTRGQLLAKSWDTLMAAGSGMATGYAVQRGLDMLHTWYNEDKLPWAYKEEESAQQHARALRTGQLMALSGAINHLLLPWMLWEEGRPGELSAHRLRTQGIRNDFSGALAGAVSGLAARSVYAGYSWWQGETTGYELGTGLADAAARSVPTTLGSMAGHWVLPWAFDVPYLSTFFPIGYVGAVAGGVLGNMAYDSAKYYAQAGIQAGASALSRHFLSLPYPWPSDEDAVAKGKTMDATTDSHNSP